MKKPIFENGLFISITLRSLRELCVRFVRFAHSACYLVSAGVSVVTAGVSVVTAGVSVVAAGAGVTAGVSVVAGVTVSSAGVVVATHPVKARRDRAETKTRSLFIVLNRLKRIYKDSFPILKKKGLFAIDFSNYRLASMDLLVSCHIFYLMYRFE